MSSDATAAMDNSLIPPVERLIDGSSSVEQFIAFGEGFVRNTRHYLQELGPIIKPDGHAVITYFLLNDESRAFVAKDVDVIKMKMEWDGDPLCRVKNLEVPEIATAHDEARVRVYTAEAGFSVGEITFGNWCGRPGAGLQDVMVLTRT